MVHTASMRAGRQTYVEAGRDQENGGGVDGKRRRQDAHRLDGAHAEAHGRDERHGRPGDGDAQRRVRGRHWDARDVGLAAAAVSDAVVGQRRVGGDDVETASRAHVEPLQQPRVRLLADARIPEMRVERRLGIRLRLGRELRRRLRVEWELRLRVEWELRLGLGLGLGLGPRSRVGSTSAATLASLLDLVLVVLVVVVVVVVGGGHVGATVSVRVDRVIRVAVQLCRVRVAVRGCTWDGRWSGRTAAAGRHRGGGHVLVRRKCPAVPQIARCLGRGSVGRHRFKVARLKDFVGRRLASCLAVLHGQKLALLAPQGLPVRRCGGER